MFELWIDGQYVAAFDTRVDAENVAAWGSGVRVEILEACDHVTHYNSPVGTDLEQCSRCGAVIQSEMGE